MTAEHIAPVNLNGPGWPDIRAQPALYRFAGSSLRSNIALPELGSANTAPDWSLEFVTQRKPEPLPCRWFHRWCLPDGGVWLRIGRIASSFVLEFANQARFTVSPEDGLIRCFAPEQTPAETIRHLFLDQVMPLALSLRGNFILHASAVAFSRRAVAFAGLTGSGKSTLAASFSSQGCSLLADDCLHIQERAGKLVGSSLYSGLRLMPDSASAVLESHRQTLPVAHYTLKRRFGPAEARIRFSLKPAPLAAIYFLTSPADFTLTQISAREAFIELVRYAFLLDVGDPAGLTRQFEFIRGALAHLSFFRLSIPRRFEELAAVRERILRA